MATVMGDQETDSIPGILHMKIVKHRLNKQGRFIGHGDYHAPNTIDILGIVGGEIVADSQQVRQHSFVVSCHVELFVLQFDIRMAPTGQQVLAFQLPSKHASKMRASDLHFTWHKTSASHLHAV